MMIVFTILTTTTLYCAHQWWYYNTKAKAMQALALKREDDYMIEARKRQNMRLVACQLAVYLSSYGNGHKSDIDWFMQAMEQVSFDLANGGVPFNVSEITNLNNIDKETSINAN